jgi:hypothetical protein
VRAMVRRERALSEAGAPPLGDWPAGTLARTRDGHTILREPTALTPRHHKRSESKWNKGRGNNE